MYISILRYTVEPRYIERPLKRTPLNFQLLFKYVSIYFFMKKDQGNPLERNRITF